MPVLHTSSYRNPPLYQFNGHMQTIFPGTFRKIEGFQYERERLVLSDGDFVDLDWLETGSKKLVILSHGLEGNSERHYIKGMAKLFSENGWDILAWNCRSCSGEMNRAFRLYSHGEIGDFGEVIHHALKTKHYEKVALVGFSMGGSITLKYLGVHGKNVPDAIKYGVAFSTPCDVKAASETLNKPSNRLYYKRFLKKLKVKLEQKAVVFPDKIDLTKLENIKVWRDFDEYFSAPLCGCPDAEGFYQQSSAKYYMSGITVPTLLVNAQNDPILAPECFPTDICEKHPFVHLEMPKQGGHVGFEIRNKPYMWSEYRALEFCA
ncbi:MAG: YheT family hydrolase [Saprospiraceae bacterium]